MEMEGKSENEKLERLAEWELRYGAGRGSVARFCQRDRGT
jgi:hypothetical protein